MNCLILINFQKTLFYIIFFSFYQQANNITRTIKYIKEMKTPTIAPSTKDRMDSVITPIIDIIHKNKIRSYHQMIYEENYNLELPKRKNKYIFPDKPKTALQHYNPREFSFKNQPVYSVKTVRTSPRLQSEQKKTFIGNPELGGLDKLSKRQMGQNSMSVASGRRRKLKSSKNNSTIKKHLIENIDFQQIQKILYKKSESVTRYQYFLLRRQLKKQLKQKINSNSASPIVSQAHKSISDQSSLEIRLNQQSQNCAVFKIRTPPKKKFWLHEQVKTKANRKQSKIVEGKKYQTIN